MNKIGKSFALFFSVALIALTLAACGDAKPEGNFVADSFEVKINGITVSGSVSDLTSNADLDAATKIVLGLLAAVRLEFSGDEITTYAFGATNTVKFKMEGNNIIEAEDEEGEEDGLEDIGSFTYKNGVLSLQASEAGTDVTIIFKKL